VLSTGAISPLKPLLKWPGGKRFLAPLISEQFVASRARRYVEPFAGGAAVLFEIEPKRALISDTNSELMNLYAVVRDQTAQLLARLRKFQNSETEYYRVRSSRPRSAIERAARAYYLQRLSFNGIYRENLAGEFNVPYGQKRHLACFDKVEILGAAAVLARCHLSAQDFRVTLSRVGEGDFVYIDPPYTVTHNDNGFIKYNSRLFSWKDQIDLAQEATSAARRGAHITVSNANHHEVKRLYRAFKYDEVVRTSKIAASSWARRKISEALFVSK
jgi:DNA adenine methylase